MPFFGDEEQRWNYTVRGLIYLTALFYLFMGVNVVADFFMSAIEAITSKKKRVYNKRIGRTVTILVWNDTVANLSLLALGSSAPEIMLACIEVGVNKFYSGALGPSTIVGSAAFNLLIIVSVCIVSIESPEIRQVNDLRVYAVTVVFSFFAYFWLLAIVQFISPNVVEIWEALLTLAMFPVLVGVSFAVDKGYLFSSGENQSESGIDIRRLSLDPDGRSGNGTSSRREEETVLELGNGGNHLAEKIHPRIRKAGSHLHHHHHHLYKRHSSRTQAQSPAPATGRCSLHLRAGSNSGSLVVQPVSLSNQCSTDSVAGHLAVPGASGTGQDPSILRDSQDNPYAIDAGIIAFPFDEVRVAGTAEAQPLVVDVQRHNGDTGVITCKYKTCGLDAVADHDFMDARGSLTFHNGEILKQVQLEILPKRVGEKDDTFQLILEDPDGGAIFNPNDDGGRYFANLTVIVDKRKDAPASGLGESLWIFVRESLLDWDNFQSGVEAWQDQVKSSFVIGDDDDEDEEEEVYSDEGGRDGSTEKDVADTSHSVFDYVMFGLEFPWKFLFAVASPPSQWGGGWLLFWAALGYIAIITAFINDLASLFGCCAGLDDLTTAITIVALGTSLPDMFASQTSAKNDEHADASIVNVTGSNSVNVFLGIGLPWSACAIFWAVEGPTDEWRATYPDLEKDFPGGAFIVQGGSLTFSVLIFNSVAVICISLLKVRRSLCGGELGGERVTKLVSSVILLVLWATYIGLSIWRTQSEGATVMVFPTMVIGVLAIAGAIVFDSCCKHRHYENSGREGEEAPIRSSRCNGGETNKLSHNIQIVCDTAEGDGGWGIADEAPVSGGQTETILRCSFAGRASRGSVTMPTTLGKALDAEEDAEEDKAPSEKKDRKAKKDKKAEKDRKSDTIYDPDDKRPVKPKTERKQKKRDKGDADSRQGDEQPASATESAEEGQGGSDGDRPSTSKKTKGKSKTTRRTKDNASDDQGADGAQAKKTTKSKTKKTVKEGPPGSRIGDGGGQHPLILQGNSRENAAVSNDGTE